MLYGHLPQTCFGAGNQAHQHPPRTAEELLSLQTTNRPPPGQIWLELSARFRWLMDTCFLIVVFMIFESSQPWEADSVQLAFRGATCVRAGNDSSIVFHRLLPHCPPIRVLDRQQTRACASGMHESIPGVSCRPVSACAPRHGSKSAAADAPVIDYQDTSRVCFANGIDQWSRALAIS